MNKTLWQRVLGCSLVAAFLMICGCQGVNGEPFGPIDDIEIIGDPLHRGTDGFPWWNDAVFYEIFVRSFQDSNGNGIGDINGLIDRLDYLNDGDSNTNTDLGVTGIWLMPIMESPSYHGYDVADYYAIDRGYGTMNDFRRLLDEAHKRGIRVIVDLVLNHTSTRHPWFQDSINANADKRDWYIWADDPPSYRGPWGQKVWHNAFGSAYYGLFWAGMPDLNYDNPEVTAQMEDVTRFWLEDVGVDGFRLDAIKHLVEEGRTQENTDSTHSWLADYYRFYKSISPNALTVGEAWTSTRQVLNYTGNEVDIAFQFDLAETILQTTEYGAASIISRDLAAIVESFPAGQYATFLTNHDQNRLMSQLGMDENLVKVAASILLTSPGVPFIYYGEEIGMTGTKPDEDIRRPMQWTSNRDTAGFTEGTPWRDPASAPPDRNVASQQDEVGSLLSHYRQLIHARNQYEALRIGDWHPVKVEGSRKLYATLRTSDNETALVLINMGEDPVADYGLSIADRVWNRNSLPSLATTVIGRGEPSIPELNDDGGIDEYMPIPDIGPYETTIIVFHHD